MKKEFSNIYLSWRQGTGHRRHIVGVIKRNATQGVRFYYFKESVEKAKKQGFIPYTEFPEVSKIYSENVLEIFSNRLINLERPDIQEFYSFWEISNKFKEDKCYLLAHTQGLLPTDNFELLADYYPLKNIKFITDLAGVSHQKLKPSDVSVWDKLRYIKERDNPKDPYAIKVFKGDVELGYIKKIHANIFHKKYSEGLALTVKAIEKNGVIKKIFVKVSF